MIGIDNLKLVSKAAGALGSACAGALQDKQLTLSDLSFLPMLYPVMPMLTGLKISELVAEIKDLSDEEVQELHHIFAESLSMPNIIVEGMFEHCMLAVLTVIKTVFLIKSAMEPVPPPAV